jgi:hypothetical protein
MVHPFWRLDETSVSTAALGETVKAAAADSVYFVDTFDVARRPVKAIEHARNRVPGLP